MVVTAADVGEGFLVGGRGLDVDGCGLVAVVDAHAIGARGVRRPRCSHGRFCSRSGHAKKTSDYVIQGRSGRHFRLVIDRRSRFG